MNKTQRKEHRQSIRRAAAERASLKKKEILMKQEEDPGDILEDEELPGEEATTEESEEWEDEEVEESELKEKDLGYPEAVTLAVGPTSFEELDQARLERERAMALNDLTWDVRTLVENILSEPGMALEEKAAAIQEVGSGFSGRSQEILSATNEAGIESVEEKSLDLDLLSIKGLQAHDKRNSSVLDQLKAKVSYGSRQNMPDSNFAFVTTRNGKKVRKYLIHDANHVRNALARAAQEIAAGGQAAEDAHVAMSKIRAAAKKFGIESSTKKDRNAILVEKDGHGEWRWVGWVTNNFIDWDGDIFCEAAHKEYVEWWEKNKDMSPVFVTWHTPGTARAEPADFMTYEHGFLIMSGKLSGPEAITLLKARQNFDLGMSHGTLIFERDAEDPRVVTKYRMYEVSDLPLDNAANPFTDLETVTKEVGMKSKLDYFTAIMGSEEKAKAFLEKTGMKEKELLNVGVTSKEAETPVTPPPTPPAPVIPVLQIPGLSAEAQKEIVGQVLKAMDVEGLNLTIKALKEESEKVPLLEKLVKEMQTDQTEKLAELLTPPAGARFVWSQENRPSETEKNLVTAEDKNKVHEPGVPDDYWLSKATQTVPVKEEAKV
jgi:hypothetical protein